MIARWISIHQDKLCEYGVVLIPREEVAGDYERVGYFKNHEEDGFVFVEDEEDQKATVRIF